jgi:DNA-binding NtrC family response regulator
MSTADAMRPRVLITDDEPDIRNDLSDYLSHLGYDVSVADDAGSTLSQVTETAFGVLLLDDMLPDESGLEILPELLDIRPSLSVIVMTGCPTVKSVIKAMRRGACDFVVKPFELDELKTAVHRAVQRNRRLVDEAFRNCKDTTRDSGAVTNLISQD